MNGAGVSQHVKSSDKQSTGLAISAMRTCKGTHCKVKRQSCGQFKGNSEICNTCVRRTPKVAP